MDALFHRTSVRQFTDEPVFKEDIIKILKAGMQAPSAGNQQPWEFYVVTNKEMIKKLSTVSPYAKCAANAPVVIVPVARLTGLRFPMYSDIDMSIAQENIWLAADALGLGGVWLGIAPIKERMDRVNEILDLPDHLTAFSLFPLGYPAVVKPQADRFDKERIHFITD
ncbi:MAG: nitroreductase family protein [Erysipelotrichaceae bacterium]|nr:nitroreductase family protein [Erysipelotrichaceae bacterium]